MNLANIERTSHSGSFYFVSGVDNSKIITGKDNSGATSQFLPGHDNKLLAI